MRLKDYQKWYRYNWESEVFPKISQSFKENKKLTKEQFMRIIVFKAERSKIKFKNHAKCKEFLK